MADRNNIVATVTGTDDLQSLTDKAQAVIDQARKGDTRAMAILRNAVNESTVWERWGNLAAQSELNLVRVMAGEDLVLQEATSRKLAALRAEIGDTYDSPLERLLVDRIVLCWLQLAYADAFFTENTARLTKSQADFYQKRISRCHTRYLSAIRSLALVRRLLGPSLTQVNIQQAGQVNVGEKQVNLAR